MSRVVVRILWVIALMFLLSCTAKREEVIPPPPSPAPAPLPAPAPPPVPAPAPFDVVQLRMTANQEFVGVRIRMPGGDLGDVDPAEIYLLDEATGEKYPVVRLQRIGKLAEFGVPGEEGTRYVMFRNRDGRLKVGKRVTIVVGKSRQEHLVIGR